MKKFVKIFSFIIMIFFLTNCWGDIKPVSGLCYLNDSLISDIKGFKKDSNSFFIPKYLYKDTIRMESKLDSFDFVFNSLFYSYFNEPVYYNYYLGEDRYRLMETPWLGPYPYIIIIFKQKNRYFIEGKFLKQGMNYFIKEFHRLAKIDSLGFVHESSLNTIRKMRYKSNFTFKDSIKEISKKEWNQFKWLLDSVNFWNTLPKRDSLPTIDGSTWILEGHEKERYWYILKDCDEACKYLRKLSPISHDIFFE